MLIKDHQFLVAQKRIHNDLTSDERQLKKQRIDQKLNAYKEKAPSQARVS